jgi:hypothetical protein
VIKAVDIRTELAALPDLRARTASTPADQVKAAFAVTVLSATPQPTEHTSAPDPRTAS